MVNNLMVESAHWVLRRLMYQSKSPRVIAIMTATVCQISPRGSE
jgi:hypothetical protein